MPRRMTARVGVVRVVRGKNKGKLVHAYIYPNGRWTGLRSPSKKSRKGIQNNAGQQPRIYPQHPTGKSGSIRSRRVAAQRAAATHHAAKKRATKAAKALVKTRAKAPRAKSKSRRGSSLLSKSRRRR